MSMASAPQPVRRVEVRIRAEEVPLADQGESPIDDALVRWRPPKRPAGWGTRDHPYNPPPSGHLGGTAFMAVGPVSGNPGRSASERRAFARFRRGLIRRCADDEQEPCPRNHEVEAGNYPHGSHIQPKNVVGNENTGPGYLQQVADTGAQRAKETDTQLFTAKHSGPDIAPEEEDCRYA